MFSLKVFFRGFHGDCAETFAVGRIDTEAQLLIDVTRECRDEAISLCGPGVPLCAIGHKIRYYIGAELVLAACHQNLSNVFMFLIDKYKLVIRYKVLQTV